MPRLSAHYRQLSFLEACRAEFASSTVAGVLLTVMKVSRSSTMQNILSACVRLPIKVGQIAFEIDLVPALLERVDVHLWLRKQWLRQWYCTIALHREAGLSSPTTALSIKKTAMTNSNR